MDMAIKRGKLLILSVLAGAVLMPFAAQADVTINPSPSTTGDKPPIIVKQGNTRYIFTSQDDKFRSMLLNSKNLRIHTRPKKYDPREFYPDYYSHHKYIRDYENYDARDASYDSGYAAGYFLTKDRD
jgi:hypothetical protein